MKSKWVAVVLVVSVALNLALAGFLVGSRAVKGSDLDPTRAYPRWVRTLEEPRRDALRPVVVEHMRAMRPKLRTLRQQHRALQAAIQSEPFDAAALAAALAEMRAEQDRVAQASHVSFAEFVEQLTPAERRLLVADMGKPRRRHPPPHMGGPRGPDERGAAPDGKNPHGF